jgi:predicted xylose isomerase-like sugar epimerase
MLFILAMEPLHHMLDHAAMQGLLSPLAGRGAKLRVSLYADDAAIFVNPQKDDLQTQWLMFCNYLVKYLV